MALRTTRRALALLPVLALALAGTACGGSGSGNTPASGSSTGTPVQLINAGKLTTCTHLPYPPFQDKQGDKVVGLDVDIIDLVAKQLNVKQDIVDISFETIESGESLNSNQCDVAAAAMTINDKRKKSFDFSDPYFDATQALLVKKGSGINSLDQLKGKKLGVQSATTGAEYAQANAKGAQIQTFDDLALEETAVQTGQIDAGINDNSVLYPFAAKNSKDVEVTKEFNTGEQYGFGVKKGNAALLAKINDAIKKAKSDGTYDTLYLKWIGKKAGQG
jgi:polar amino acid transport system substrate-binding protein